MNSHKYNQYQSIAILKLVTISCVISLSVFIGNGEERRGHKQVLRQAKEMMFSEWPYP